MYELPPVCPTCVNVPPLEPGARSTSYVNTQPGAAVTAQVNVAEEEVVPGEARLPGAGGGLSKHPCAVVVTSRAYASLRTAANTFT